MMDATDGRGSHVNLTAFPDHFSEGFLTYQPTLRQRIQARCFSKEKYVESVLLSQNGDFKIEIDAKTHRSQRKNEPPHSVHICIDTEKVCDASCTCKAGISGKCAHVLAVIMTIEDWILEGYKDVPSDPACTSLPQEWHKPRGTKIMPQPVSQMVIVKTSNISRKRKPVMPMMYDNRKVKIDPADQSAIRQLKGTPISYLAQDCTDSVDTAVALRTVGSGLSYQGTPISYLAQDCTDSVDTAVALRAVGSGLSYQEPLMGLNIGPAGSTSECGDIIFPKSPQVPNPANFETIKTEWAHLCLTMQEAKNLEGETRKQAENQRWFDERKKRITASKFASFIKRKMVVTDKFLVNTLLKKVRVKATEYGTSNERIAKIKYTEQEKHHIHEVGLVINPSFPFLGASPDGIICDDGESGILEVKCPISMKDYTIAEACKKGKTFCLHETADGIFLKPTHDYMYQVQGQLLVTGAPFCDFVVYTHEEIFVQRILPNLELQSVMLAKLAAVYCEHVKPFIDKQ